jgi:hypothetical protein
MKIRWKQPVELEVVTSFDEATDTPETENELLRAGAISEGDIVDYNEESVTFQFSDGSLAFNVMKDWFTIDPEDDLFDGNI